MIVMPPFFLVAAIVGALIWLSGAPYPFPLLAELIVVGSVVGFALSTLYVHDFMPWRWRSVVSALRRLRMPR